MSVEASTAILKPATLIPAKIPGVFVCNALPGNFPVRKSSLLSSNRREKNITPIFEPQIGKTHILSGLTMEADSNFLGK